MVVEGVADEGVPPPDRQAGGGAFEPVQARIGSWRWQLHPEALEAIRTLAAPPDLVARGFAALKVPDDRGVFVGDLAFADGLRPVVVKTHHVRKFRLHLLHLIGPTRAAREWQNHRQALAAGLPVVMPWGHGERLRLGAPVSSVLVTEFWQHDGSLARLADDPAAAPVLGSVLEELGSVVLRMHRVGLFHGDLHPGNVLVRTTGEDRLRVIDWKHVNWRSTRDAGPVGQLAKLCWQFRLAGVFGAEHAGREDAFFAGYVGSGGSAALRPEIEKAVRATAARLAERAARRCTESNSTFAWRREGDWLIHWRRDPGLDVLPPDLASARALAGAVGEARKTQTGRGLVVEARPSAREGWIEANCALARGERGTRSPLAWIERASAPQAGWLVWIEDGR